MNLSNDRYGSKRIEETSKSCKINMMIAFLDSLTKDGLWKLILSRKIRKSRDDSKFTSAISSKLKNLLSTSTISISLVTKDVIELKSIEN